jgi:hypothetical protein
MTSLPRKFARELGRCGWVFGAAVAGCIGCTTTGTATGQLVTPQGGSARVTFVWRSEPGDPREGKISVVLPDGRSFEGEYRQVSSSAPVDFYRPLWSGWDPYWANWRTPWYDRPYGGDWNGWITVYEGRVVARLKARQSAEYMRCRFALDNPDQGLAGGGTGDCQLSSGAEIKNAELEVKGDDTGHRSE